MEMMVQMVMVMVMVMKAMPTMTSIDGNSLLNDLSQYSNLRLESSTVLGGKNDMIR